MNLYEIPHFHDPKRPYMSKHDRAAQFMPFKSLRGFDDMVDDKNEQVLGTDWEKIIYDDEYLIDPDNV